MLLTFPFMQNQPTKQHKDELRIRNTKTQRETAQDRFGGTRISYPPGNTSIPNELG